MKKRHLIFATLLCSFPAVVAAQGDGELPGDGGGECWKCKSITFPNGSGGTFTVHECDPGWASGTKGCTNGGNGTTSSCSPSGGPCGGPGGEDLILATGWLSKDGMAHGRTRLTLATIEHPEHNQHSTGFVLVAPRTREPRRDCRGYIIAGVSGLTDEAISATANNSRSGGFD